MAGRLNGKVAIVTGATSGIGRAVTSLFAREGARVVFAGRREDLGQELERELALSGGEAIFVRTDVTKTEDLQYLVSSTAERYGRIDVLVNNADAVSPDSSAKFDELGSYEEIFCVNVKSYLVTCREVLPYMIRQKKGSIVNASSVIAEVAFPGLATYAASKGAVLSFTRSLAGEYADQGIRVNCVMPGLTAADASAAGGSMERVLQDIPMGRAASPEEIAYGFLFFASDESSFCTGSVLVIDGGLTAV